MFCIECGQRMADEAKFCPYCGTRRAVPAPVGEAPSAQNPPVRPVEPPSAAPVTPPAPAVRLTRSTAEIMPIRGPNTTPVPPPRVQPVAPEEVTEPEALKPDRFEYEAGPSSAPIPIEPAIVDDESAWQTAAPVPADAYSQPGEYEDRGPLNSPAPVEARRPSVPVAKKPEPAAYAAVPFAAPDYSHDVAPARRKISPVLIVAVIVALIAAAGIIWMLRTSMSGGSSTANKVEITMFPTTAKAVAGKGKDFAATVTGAPTSEVTWKIEEGDNAGTIQTRGASAKEGAISLYATFTPKAAGTYHLVATSTADPSKSASAEVTVTAK